LEESDFAKTRSERNQQQVERNFAGKTNSNHHHHHITKETRTCDTTRSDSRDEMAGSRIASFCSRFRLRSLSLGIGMWPCGMARRRFRFRLGSTRAQTRFALQFAAHLASYPRVRFFARKSLYYGLPICFFFKSASTAEKIVYQLNNVLYIQIISIFLKNIYI
jgi:hypothetical protein